jgi:mono/diheme cytochrome c family protein
MRIIGLAVVIIAVIVFVASCESSVSASKMEDGKKVYAANCLGCHMDNGKGVPRMNPSLVNSPYVMGHPNSLIELVLRGSDFFGTTKRSYNNQMASFHALSDTEIASLLTYIRNTYAKTGDEVNADEVKKVRAKLK